LEKIRKENPLTQESREVRKPRSTWIKALDPFNVPPVRISHYSGNLTVKYAKRKILFMLLSLREGSCNAEKVKRCHLSNKQVQNSQKKKIAKFLKYFLSAR